MSELADNVTGWVDSPGDLLAWASLVAMVLGGLVWLIEARLGTIRQRIDDMREANDATHEQIVTRLDDHIRTHGINRREGDTR